MGTLGSFGWAFVVLGGMVILGLVIFYGEMRNRTRTPEEKAVTEVATHRLYEKEEREV
jgi:hypothetical protein